MHRAAEAHRWSDVADLDMRFHLALVEAAGSARLSRMYSTLIDETRSLLSLTAEYPGREDLVEEHADVAGLIETGDMDAARGALARHFASSRLTFQSHRHTADVS